MLLVSLESVVREWWCNHGWVRLTSKPKGAARKKASVIGPQCVEKRNTMCETRMYTSAHDVRTDCKQLHRPDSQKHPPQPPNRRIPSRDLHMRVSTQHVHDN